MNTYHLARWFAGMLVLLFCLIAGATITGWAKAYNQPALAGKQVLTKERR